MGMFDYVRFQHDCPNCDATLNEFQSKDGPCDLRKIKAHKLNNFYAFCDECRAMTMFYKPWGKKRWIRTVRERGPEGRWLYEFEKKFTKREIKEMVS